MAQAITATEIIDNFKKVVTTQYICFDGRMGKREFWLFVLPVWILGFVPIVGQVLLLALLLPSIGATTRRLHDVGKTGWLQLCAFICGIGFLIPLYFCILDGDKEANTYGEPPAAPSAE